MLDNLRNALQDTPRWKLVSSSTIKDLKTGVAYAYTHLGVYQLGFNNSYRFIYQGRGILEVDDEFTKLVFRLRKGERDEILLDLNKQFSTGELDGK